MEKHRWGTLRRPEVWCGVLTALLAVCAGKAQAQADPATPPDSKPVPQKASRPLVIDKPVQVLTPPLPPDTVLTPQFPAVDPAHAYTTSFNPLYEITTTFIIFMFTAGGVAALTVAARFYFRLTMPTDPKALALNDPWVRANIARLDAPALKKGLVPTNPRPPAG